MPDKNIKNKATILNLLLGNKLIPSEKTAKAYILSGNVTANGVLVDKPGTLVKIDSIIGIKEKIPYVSRGAIKLCEAVKDFKIDLSDRYLAKTSLNY